MGIQNRLRELRAARGLTQEQMATELGVSQAHVSRIEGGYAPSFELAQAVCRVLGVELSDAWPMGTDTTAGEDLAPTGT